MTPTRRLSSILLVAALAVTVSGCVGPPVTHPTATHAPAPTSSPDAPDAPENPDTPQPAGPAEQADSCEWESPRVDADPAAPTGQSGDLASVLIGSWQHTHFNSGSGWESSTNDIRYVFPSLDRLLYCQHVEGVTDHAENRADISLEGALIQPPSPHPGFEATAWSADRMLWTNNYDGSSYLLVRR